LWIIKRRFFGGVAITTQLFRAIWLVALPPGNPGRLLIFGFGSCVPGLDRATEGPDKLIALADEMIQ
jgi:hypothetical protein